jgi:hypothetical protein
VRLFGYDKCLSDFDYFSKLQNALRPTPFSITDGVSQGVASPLIDGVPKSEMDFADMMKLLEDIETLERRELSEESGAESNQQVIQQEVPNNTNDNENNDRNNDDNDSLSLVSDNGAQLEFENK